MKTIVPGAYDMCVYRHAHSHIFICDSKKGRVQGARQTG